MRDHLLLVCVQRGVTFVNDMKADGRYEGQSVHPRRRWFLSKPMCSRIFFSLCQRISSPSKLAVPRLWCWAEDEGWAPATFPLSQWQEGTYRLFVLFSWWVKSWQSRDSGMLSITLPGNFTHSQGKIKCLSNGFGTQLTSDKESMKSLSRGTQPQDNSHTLSPALPLRRDLFLFLQLHTLALPASCLPGHILAIPTSGAQRSLG